jgi:hypothetical protein
MILLLNLLNSFMTEHKYLLKITQGKYIYFTQRVTNFFWNQHILADYLNKIYDFFEAMLHLLCW